MTTTVHTPTRRPHWIDDWRPEDGQFWETRGKAIARRNLIFSVLSEHIGFSVWSLWSVLVLFLGPADGSTRPEVPALRAAPPGRCTCVQIPYTFAVGRSAGNWTIVAGLLLLMPDHRWSHRPRARGSPSTPC